MTKLVFFGAGDASLRAVQLLNDLEYQIVAFLDDDPGKQGKNLRGIPIVKPDVLSENASTPLKYDYIVISIIHENAVKERLINQYKIDKTRIIDWYFNDIFDVRRGALRLFAEEIYENNITGNVAELGVYKGEFAKFINRAFPDRTLYLFDTFSGFDKTDVAFEKECGYHTSSENDFTNESIELVLSKMKPRDSCRVVQGYFPASARGIEDTFCFVSLDADLYLPTIEGLRWFFPRLVKGGAIFIHDVNGVRFPGAKKALREFCCEFPEVNYVSLPDVSGTAIIRK